MMIPLRQIVTVDEDTSWIFFFFFFSYSHFLSNECLGSSGKQEILQALLSPLFCFHIFFFFFFSFMCLMCSINFMGSLIESFMTKILVSLGKG